jgi:hypothetical protein
MACQENCGEGTVTQARRRGGGGPPRGGAADVSAPVRGAVEGAKRIGPRGSKAEGAPGVVQAVQVGEADVAPSSAVRVLGVAGLHLQDDLRDTCLVVDCEAVDCRLCRLVVDCPCGSRPL